MSKKRFALITTETKTFTSKKLLEEAQNLGAEVEIINPFKTSLVVEKNSFTVFIKGKKISPPTAAYRKTIITEKAKILEFFLWKKGAKIINPWNKIPYQAKGKFGVYQLLAENRIPVPKSFLLTNQKERGFCLDFFHHQFPLIVKTNAGTHGIGVILCESKTSFISLTDYLLQKENELIIQEFIKTSFGKDKRIILLNQKILAAVERKNQKGDFRSNVFLGADVFPTNLNNQEEKIALKTMAVLGLNFGGLDMLYGENGPIITEVNAPCDYSCVEKTTGVPISREIVSFLLEA
jgi:RimK family alpha-L-glutamate ligase